MSDRNSSASSGVSITTVLVVVFTTLKIVGTIHWSWIWVFSPWWISLLVSGVLLFVIGIIKGTMEHLDNRKWEKAFRRKYPNA